MPSPPLPDTALPPIVTMEEWAGRLAGKGCAGCSYLADHVPYLDHLRAWDTTFVMASPGDQEKIADLRRRSGWDHVPWYTLVGDAFDRDFGVAEMLPPYRAQRRGEYP